jgi:hypothetical protein
MNFKTFALTCFILAQPQISMASDVDSGKVPIGVTRLPEYNDVESPQDLAVSADKTDSWRGFDANSGSAYNAPAATGSNNPNYLPATNRQPASTRKSATAYARPASANTNSNTVAGSPFGASADTPASAGWSGNANNSDMNSNGAAAGTYADQQNSLRNQHQQALQLLDASGTATANQFTKNPVGSGLGVLSSGGWR